jgi:hypothetical protein
MMAVVVMVAVPALVAAAETSIAETMLVDVENQRRVVSMKILKSMAIR